MANPIVFFDMTADGAPLGRIEMEVGGWEVSWVMLVPPS
jgi:hypothetical protein